MTFKLIMSMIIIEINITTTRGNFEIASEQRSWDGSTSSLKARLMLCPDSCIEKRVRFTM